MDSAECEVLSAEFGAIKLEGNFVGVGLVDF